MHTNNLLNEQKDTTYIELNSRCIKYHFHTYVEIHSQTHIHKYSADTATAKSMKTHKEGYMNTGF